MKENSIKDYLSLAVEVAREAGDFAKGVQVSELTITTKTNEMDIVTQVDSRNEQTIRDTVLAHYPDHVFLGEELGDSEDPSPALPLQKGRAGEGSVRWIIDPVDGTVNYAHGL